MALPIDLNPHWLASSAGYQIERSLRFNSADSAYLNRTLGSSGNRKTWTWSGWIKGMGSGDVIFGAAGSTGGQGALYFTSSSLTLREYAVETGSETFSVITTAKYRDPSAWYHIVAVFDTTQATSSNRIKLYVNGIQVTALSTASYPSLNFDAYNINNSSKRALIGTENYSGSGTMNGYMTEVNFIDGQALTPSSFGETDSATGVWKPKEYTGTYGTNGFYLNFSDNSGTTSTTLGKDYSGNGNNWTPNNFSIATTSSIVYEIDGSGNSENGGFSYYIKVSGAGAVNLTANGGGGNLAGPTFTGISSISGNLNDWGNSIVRKNGAYLFAVAGGRVTNDSGSQTATQARSANSVTQTSVSVADGDILSIDFGVNSTVTAYFGYPTAPKFSVTAINGASLVDVNNDSSVDTPTSYGIDTGVGNTVRGNYATLNPLSKAAAASITNGNLTGTTTTAAEEGIYATLAVSSGKWYFEATPTVITSGGCMIGVAPSSTQGSSGAPGLSVTTGYGYYTTGNKYNGSGTAYGNTFTINDVIGVALDLDNGKIYWSKNGTFQNSGDPVAGTNAAYTGISGTFVAGIGNGGSTSSSTVNMNFGQRPFAYAAPSGFKALCTANLPTPTIKQGDDYFNVVTYTGNGTAISNNTVGFQPDWTWIKGRSGATNHQLFDSLRGATKVLISNVNGPESTAANTLTSFDSNGFTVGSNTALNTSTATYVAWNWNAGGSTANNTNGTITSTLRANPTAGFSVVIYGGNGIDGATVGHGLGVVPSMIIQKRRDGSIGGWRVWHSAIYATSGVTSTLYLNLDYASTADGDVISGVSSTTFTTAGTGATNPNGNGCVAYVFAAVDGYSAFGKYTGNGSADGPFVYTGFRPRYVMIKRTDSTSDWTVWDTARNTYNTMNLALYPNLSNAEVTTSIVIDTVSNGIKIRNSNADTNASGGTYIYAAFAENPFKYSLAR